MTFFNEDAYLTIVNLT